ncbi:MAG TPA: FAD binding domain-containing protein [Chloroflexota bacterium]|nr:FAD binding domain-containing protein [Chloroflexota bacterium]
MLSPFRVVHPTSIREATAELERLGEQASVYAGGAELLLLMRQGLLQPDYLVNIKRIAGLDVIEANGSTVRIGAAVTHRRLESDPTIRERLPALADAEHHVGNTRVRNQGTLGGNLCFADPHADPGTALLIYGASVTISSSAGERTLPLAEFLVGTYETAVNSGELLTSIEATPLPAGWNAAFLRVERFSRPTVNVAAAASLAPNGRLSEARLAVGCVGPKAIRLSDLEERVVGTTVAEAQRVIGESSAYLAERLEPVGDLLGSASYKITIARVLLQRAIEQAAATNGRTQHGGN